MRQFVDISNKTFGRLNVIRFIKSNEHHQNIWECCCECGNIIQASTASLMSGNTKSCGCLKIERIENANTKHGYSGTKIYCVWKTMKQRCYSVNDKDYHNYGGRGITICEEWQNDAEMFVTWALNNGYKEGLTIERVNNEKGYAPDNCKWVTRKEQNMNKRTNINYNERLVLNLWH